MDVSGDYVFDAPQQLVWDALLDPNVLGSIMPGGKGFEQTGENQYGGVLEVKVGPVQGTFQGQIVLSDIVPPESYQIVVDGKGATGFVKGTGNLHLEPRDQQTYLQYSGTAQVGGRIASVGQRLIDSAARSIIRQSLDALNEYLKIEAARQPVVAAVAAASNGAAEAADSHAAPAAVVVAEAAHPVAIEAAPAPVPVAYKPPSQMALGLQVARDVLNDLLPGGYQPWLYATLIVVVVLIIMFAAGRP